VRLVAYLRVSTLGQVTDGLGLPTQERLIRAWARQAGHRVVAVYSDNGKSGTLPDAERPGLLEALGAIRHHEADAVVVSSLDRIARFLSVQEAVLAKVWSLGGIVFTVDTGEVQRDDPDDPLRTALRQIIGVFAQLDRGMTIKRLRNGRQTKAAQGGYAGFGSPAYGFRAEGGQLVPDPEEAKAVKRIRQLHKAGRSLRETAETLTAEGYRPKRSDRWHPESLRRIVARLEGR
jgi:DNA invertase Pin-like site-specific DNA recombinase